MVEVYDVGIVGSGFGGGTLALRAAQAGKTVCVLERGRRWRGKNLSPQKGDPASSPFPLVGEKHFFWGADSWKPWRQRLGLYEIRQMSILQALLGAGVGGGSLIWANVVMDAPEWIFAESWPKGIDRQSLDPYYKMADAFLKPQFVPGTPGITAGPSGSLKRAELHKMAAERLGKPWYPVKAAVNFGDRFQPADNGHGRARQLGCIFCGACSAGCPQNAKNSTDKTYIAEAESLGAQVKPLHVVSRFERHGNRWRVHYKRYNLDGLLAETSYLEVEKLVISAGTFGTTELMFASGINSPALGSRFSFNGNVVDGALKRNSPGGNSPTDVGPSIASVIDYGKYAVEDYTNPFWSAGIVGISNFERICAFLLAMAGYKSSREQIIQRAHDMLVYVGVGEDSARGQLRPNAFGSLSLSWPGGIQNEPVVKALHQAMTEIARIHGREHIPNVFSVFNRLVTYHPLGGCPMSDDPRQGVVDAFGAVHGYDNLYIADGSIVPTALGRNPSYTIAALAECVAERML